MYKTVEFSIFKYILAQRSCMILFPFDMSQYKSMVFFDVETTGFDYQHGQITQFAARRVLANGTSTDINLYVKMKESVEYSKEVQEMTSLSETFLDENGIHEGLVAQQTFDFLFFAQPVVLIAHNAQFDMLFILELLKRYRYTMPVEYSVIDTMTIARDRKPFPHKLIDMMHHYNHNTEASLHRADVDLGILIDVFSSMLDEKNDIKCYLDVIGIPPKKQVTGYCLPTVKYKKQKWFHDGKTHRPVYV